MSGNVHMLGGWFHLRQEMRIWIREPFPGMVGPPDTTKVS